MSTAKATTDAAAISKQLDYLARALKGLFTIQGVVGV